MKTSYLSKRLVCFVACAILLGAIPARQSAALGRSRDEINADYIGACDQLNTATENGALFATPASRKAGAPAAIASINRILASASEMQQAGIMAQFGIDQLSVLMHIYRLALDDPSAQQLQQRAVAGGGNDAATAAVAAAAAEYLDAAQDEAAQLAAIDKLQQTIGAVKPVSMGLRGNGGMRATPVNRLPEIFMEDNPPASAAVSERIVAFLNSGTDRPWRETASQIPILEHRLELLNKPMTIAGTLVNGPGFSTAQWKGKVILVDFWATWCPDCVAALPSVAKLYSANHSRGLEILSISSDDNVPRLNNFLSQNRYISWPQLLDFQLPVIDASSVQLISHDSSGDEHPRFRHEAQAFALWNQPAFYLIDRKGNLRFAYVRAETNRDALIAKLLAEAN